MPPCSRTRFRARRRRGPRPVRSWLALVALLPLAACGAGLITGIAANENNGSETPELRPPELTLSPLLPLAPVPGSTRTVVVANAQIPASAPVRVTIAAAGVVVDQPAPSIAGQGGSTSITFGLDTAPIRAVIGNPASGDVDAELSVLVDGVAIAAPVPIVLVRQPRFEFDPILGETKFLSPLGETVTLVVSGLPSVEPENLEMLVATRDPANADPTGAPAILVRPCSNLDVTATGVGVATLTATVPGHGFADRAELFVRDAVAGESTRVLVHYRPEITLALPSQGVTTGGNLVTLIGTALATYDFSVNPPQLSFDGVELSFTKGERRVDLAREDFREEISGLDRLVFRMPASPDGRPGQVDIELGVDLGEVTAPVVASQVFLFANPDPFFGPRGAVLDQFPVSVAPIAIDNAPITTDAPDFAVLTEEAGAGFVQLLVALENGMFLRFGARRRIGDPEVAAERNPRDLCAADFDGDAIPDLFVVNAGELDAVHHVVLGQAKPATPLGALHRVSGAAGMASCRIGKFDGDGLDDLLLVPGPGAGPAVRPQVLLSRPLGVGQPGFAQPIDVPVRAMEYQAVEVADLDGDGFLDVAVTDGVQMRLDVAYGRGDGTFDPAVELDLAVPGYTPDPGSPAIGLHACGDEPHQSLGLVLGGDDDGVGADPQALIATLQQSVPRSYEGPVSVFPLGADPRGTSLIADLDGESSEELELVVAIRDEVFATVVSVGVFEFTGSGFFPVSGGIPDDGTEIRTVRSLDFSRAFPASPSLPRGAQAVFAVHESLVDGEIERRLSTLLVFNAQQGPVLLPPDGGGRWNEQVQAIVGGNWSDPAIAGEDSVRDLAVGRAGGIDLLENDGSGGFPIPGGSLSAPNIVPTTVKRVPADPGTVEALVFFDAQSRLGYWRPYQTPLELSFTSELRAISPKPELRTATLSANSIVEVADVDGDGIYDVTALLRFAVPPAADTALLVLLRGRANPTPGQTPFHDPIAATVVHGEATDFALGDFVANSIGFRELELALAVPFATVGDPLDGDHVRFFRYLPGGSPAEDRFVPSFVQPGPRFLVAGSAPTRIVADDFDRDGSIDLLVAAAGDSTLRVYRNVAQPVAGPGAEVDVAAFQESLSSPRAIVPGDPTRLALGDVNGDGAIDVVIAITDDAALPTTTAVAFYLSTEPGVFGDARFVSPSRLGDRAAAMALDLGDYNGDRVLDLFIGWDTNFGPLDRNVRVLFGGAR